ncbi:MAG: aminotransferase class [Frankiales bacterium]|nr:aminotransferase class [Frankiales bacterium]
MSDVARWVDARLPTARVHLDVAASGRVSRAVLAAQTAHLRAEADGAYVAEAEAEEGVLAEGRAALGALVGLGAGDVAFASDGGAAFATLLGAWRGGPRVGTVGSEYGGNARVLARLAAERGWQLVDLPVDALGRVRDLPDGLDLLTLPQVASQRGVAQPVAELVGSGVPVVLDVAQSLGQTTVPAGCAAYVGTSRKWLCGPRGVGFAVVAPETEAGLADPPTLAPTVHRGVRRSEQPEAHVAGRVGLAVAVREWTPELLPRVHALAARARRVLGVGGWRVVEPVDEPTGITTLLPPDGVDPVQVRGRLLEQGVLVSAVPASRAADLAGPVLRVSTAAWAREDELDALADALSRVRP